MSLDLGPQFQAEGEHFRRFKERRDAVNAKRVPTGIAFLDDCISGLRPGGLLLVGAGTGVGKSALAFGFALAAAVAGYRPHLFALEAEEGEVGDRLAFQELGKYEKHGRDFRSFMDGDLKALEAKHWSKIEKALLPKLDSIATLYKKRGDFTNKTLLQVLAEIGPKAELVILDHIHFIDSDNDNEYSTQRKAIRDLRDLALNSRVPVVAVSHMRKKSSQDRGRLMPSMDDLHGSSELSKSATDVVLIERDWDAEPPAPHLSPTLFMVPKDRRGRGGRLIARCNYDMSSGTYEEPYQLGRAVWDRGERFEPVPSRRIPFWARRAVRSNGEVPI
jgi:replicative DNA helicase